MLIKCSITEITRGKSAIVVRLHRYGRTDGINNVSRLIQPTYPSTCIERAHAAVSTRFPFSSYVSYFRGDTRQRASSDPFSFRAFMHASPDGTSSQLCLSGYTGVSTGFERSLHINQLQFIQGRNNTIILRFPRRSSV